MRNFEERRAEIFRRSEERIRQRRQNRRRMLLCCIPLVICFAVGGALMLPSMTATTESDSMEHTVGDYPIVRMEVDTGGEPLVYFDGEQILAAKEALDALLAMPESGELTESVTDTVAEAVVESENIAVTYTITLTDRTGEVETYRLSGRTLTHIESGAVRTLDESQYAGLAKLLGIE